jgi:hypothetical protein
VENSKRQYCAWCIKADEFKRKLLAQQEEAGIQVVKAISNVYGQIKAGQVAIIVVFHSADQPIAGLSGTLRRSRISI